MYMYMYMYIYMYIYIYIYSYFLKFGLKYFRLALLFQPPAKYKYAENSDKPIFFRTPCAKFKDAEFRIWIRRKLVETWGQVNGTGQRWVNTPMGPVHTLPRQIKNSEI